MNTKPLILIVDDIATNLNVLANLLSEQGYRMGFARDGRSALISMQKKQPNLVLLDVMMPEMDGFTTCEHIKKNPLLADIPIIFLSAKTEKEAVINGLKLGAVDYISKPFDKTELLTRIKTQLNLQATKQALSQALDAKNLFFSIISHDLSNLFSGLLTISSQLAGHCPTIKLTSEEIQAHNQYLFEAIGTGNNLLNNLLDWSKLQTGKLIYQPSIVDINILFDNVMASQEWKAQHKQIDLNYTIEDTAHYAYADANMLDTVLRNLVCNAIKFTRTAGKIRLISQIVDDNMLEIKVVDDGVGIAESGLKNLFSIGKHYSTLGTGGENGSGLGLSLCYELIQKNQGTLKVTSVLNQGSCFYFQLPTEIDTK